MGVGPFEYRYDPESKQSKWIKVKRSGKRKPEWNNPNEKMQAKIDRRVSAYEKMIASPSFKSKNTAGYHKPGSWKKN